MKKYAFVDEAQGTVSVSELMENDSELQSGQVFKELGDGDSSLALRYGYINGQIIDQYPGMSDEAVLSKVLADQQVVTPTVTETLDDVKKVKLLEIRTHFNNIVESLKADVAPYEVATWDVQRIEYVDWLKDHNAITPYVTALAVGRGMDLETLMSKIGVRVTALANLQGMQQALETQVTSCTTVDQVKAVSIA